MKKFFKNIAISATFLVLLILTSCAKDEFQDAITNSVAKTEISFEQFKNETGLSNFDTKIKINQNPNAVLFRNPDGTFELSDFNISTEIIKRVVVNEKITYTFQVQSVEEVHNDRFYNLTMFYNDGWQSLITELKPTEENLLQLQQGTSEKFEGTMTRLYQSDLPTIGVQTCSTIFITYGHCTGTGQCANGTCDQCNLCTSTVSYTLCGTTPAIGNPVLYIDLGPGSVGGPGGPSTTPVNEIIIEPNINPNLLPDCNGSIDCINNNKFRLFKLDLLPTQSAILNNNPTLNTSIYNYLSENDFSSESEIFAVEMIDTSILLEINAVEVWNDYDNFRNQMSISEKAIFDNLLPNRKLWYMVSAKKAFDKANELFPNSTHNGKGDAFRHALWNGLCALTLAGNLGEQLTTAHENRPSLYPFNYKETQMDLYNNEKGRQVAIISNLTNIIDNILQDLNNGNLRYLNNLDANDNNNATYYSILIPTDQ